MNVLRSRWALGLLALSALPGLIVLRGGASAGWALLTSLAGIVIVLLAAAILSPD